MTSPRANASLVMHLKKIFEYFLRNHHMEGEPILWPIVWIKERRNMQNTIEPAAMIYPDSLIRRTRDQKPNPLLSVSHGTRDLVLHQDKRRYIPLPVYFYPDSSPPTEPHDGRFVDRVIIHLYRDAVIFDHEGCRNRHRASPYGGLSLEVQPFPTKIPRGIQLQEGALAALQGIASRIRVAMPSYGPDPSMLKRAVPQTDFYFRHVLLRSAFDFQAGNYPTFTNPWILVHLCEHHENLRAHHFDLLVPCADYGNPYTEVAPTGAEPFRFQLQLRGYYPVPYDWWKLTNEPKLLPMDD